MALNASALGAALKAATHGVNRASYGSADAYEDAVFLAFATAIVAHITANAVVTGTATAVSTGLGTAPVTGTIS